MEEDLKKYSVDVFTLTVLYWLE